MVLDDQQFDDIVAKAWEEIPDNFKREMENVSVRIEMHPTQEQLRKLHVHGTLLGLFDGVPKTAWGQATMGIQPNKITLFQEPILAYSRNLQDLEDTMKIVLLHEVAHYFGYSEDDMCIMDQKMRTRLSNKRT